MQYKMTTVSDVILNGDTVTRSKEILSGIIIFHKLLIDQSGQAAYFGPVFYPHRIVISFSHRNYW